MILTSARVTAFRSIDDSGEFTIDPVTCFVGPNGAGKSAALEALYKLNPIVARDGDFDLLDYPRKGYVDYRAKHARQPATVVATTWRLDDDDRELLRPFIGARATDSLSVRISKGYDNQQRWTIDVDEAALVQHLVGIASLEPEALLSVERATTLEELISLLQRGDVGSERQNAFLNTLLAQFPHAQVQSAIVALLRDRLPTFVRVTEYPLVPGEVALDQVMARRAHHSATSSDEAFLALMDLAGIDPNDTQRADMSEALIAELESASDRVSRDVLGSWSQGRHLRAELRCDGFRPAVGATSDSGLTFRTRIRDARQGVTLSLEQQGSGFVWFFSFLVWLSHLKRTAGDRLVFLLDQPGSLLHAEAQRDLVSYLHESRRAADTILYTTHSPVMMDESGVAAVLVIEETGIREPGTRHRAPVSGAPVPVVERLTPVAPDVPITLTPGWDSMHADGWNADAAVQAPPPAWSNELAFLRRSDH
jgi:predicted ATPase